MMNTKGQLGFSFENGICVEANNYTTKEVIYGKEAEKFWEKRERRNRWRLRLFAVPYILVALVALLLIFTFLYFLLPYRLFMATLYAMPGMILLSILKKNNDSLR